MKWDKNGKIKFYTKINRKLRFLRFSQQQKSKNHDFPMVFHKKLAVTPQKIKIFSFFTSIQAKNEKNHDFWRGLIFPILSSPRPDFHQNFAFSRP